MEARKNPKYDLLRYRTLFFNIGLVISLLMVIGAFEWRFYDKIDLMANGGSMNIEFEDVIEVPPTEQPPPPDTDPDHRPTTRKTRKNPPEKI